MRWTIPVCLLLLWGCGGGEKNEVEEPEMAGDDGADEPQGDVMIPPEKMDEIVRIFESKTSVVARCFPDAVEAGEIESSAEGFVTLGLTIQRSGEPTDVGILESNIQSDTLHQCVIEHAKNWSYPQMPKPYTTSHIYQFQEL